MRGDETTEISDSATSENACVPCSRRRENVRTPRLDVLSRIKTQFDSTSIDIDRGSVPDARADVERAELLQRWRLRHRRHLTTAKRHTDATSPTVSHHCLGVSLCVMHEQITDKLRTTNASRASRCSTMRGLAADSTGPNRRRSPNRSTSDRERKHRRPIVDKARTVVVDRRRHVEQMRQQPRRVAIDCQQPHRSTLARQIEEKKKVRKQWRASCLERPSRAAECKSSATHKQQTIDR